MQSFAVCHFQIFILLRERVCSQDVMKKRKQTFSVHRCARLILMYHLAKWIFDKVHQKLSLKKVLQVS